MTPDSKTRSASTPWTAHRKLLLVLSGLLLPGGLLLLAWLLYRRLRRRVSAQPLKRLVPMLALVALAPGCATQFAAPRVASSDAQAALEAPVLQFQNTSAEPTGQDAFIASASLQPGDILLTSMPGFAAAGIELMTVAPVSHSAVYIGDGQVVEAVREGVRTRSLEQVMAEESVALVLRYPGLSTEQAQRIRAYAQQKIGAGFSYFGVTVQIPYSIGRRACELPLVAAALRDACIRAMGLLSQLAPREEQLFCSQLVLQAFRHAGVPLTDADPRIVSPADILHMREGDVPSLGIRRSLAYVGHLKYDRPLVVASQPDDSRF
ncbi:MAG TPA: distant relative of cell wall-associated hydrolase [Burkholderiales bacterium]|nr:distant relative of cell wall-associated hydrolase [Burkholderiales bacterium]